MSNGTRLQDEYSTTCAVSHGEHALPERHKGTFVHLSLKDRDRIEVVEGLSEDEKRLPATLAKAGLEQARRARLLANHACVAILTPAQARQLAAELLVQVAHVEGLEKP